MPPLTRPQIHDLLALPPRKAELAADADVLIVGGGPAGLGAALGAAAAGADVVLVERYGYLGGNATAALVMPFMSYHTSLSAPVAGVARNLMPQDHGPGEPVVAGVLKRLVERLVSADGAIPPSLSTGYVVPFDAEVFKQVALDLLDEAGVKFLLHAFASSVVGDGRVEGVVFETKSGPVVVKAKAVVDCTGDGDVAAFAGAPFEVGREEDGLVQPMTLVFLLSQLEQRAFEGFVRDHPDQWHGVNGLWKLVEQARAGGEFDLAREDILLFGTPHGGTVSVNSTRVSRVLGTDAWDLTYAEWQSRRQMREIVTFLRRFVPGFADAYAAQSGAHVGVRETRRILGGYQLTAQDVLSARKFSDAIARGSYPIDIHDPAGAGSMLKRLPPGEAYDIPLRCLLPRRVDGLVVAGRCISGTHEAHSSYRVMPISVATGQAAGVCAALAARTTSVPRKVPAEDVQDELQRQGADLGLKHGLGRIDDAPATAEPSPRARA
ncbi:MAG: FAD-dependent oxidoreductase [Chloroflexota bacterium]